MSETFEIARKNMVVNQLRPNKINEENILQIFENTPKENYLDGSLGKNCYLDNNLDITDKRGYLKNLHLAQIIKYSKILANDKVLHICGLTGYFSALISSLCKELHVVEENRELFKLLEHNIKNTDNTNRVAYSEMYRSSTGIMVRKGKWKYIRYNSEKDYLYDIDMDPEERNNLINSTHHQEIISELSTLASTKFRKKYAVENSTENQFSVQFIANEGYKNDNLQKQKPNNGSWKVTGKNAFSVLDTEPGYLILNDDASYKKAVFQKGLPKANKKYIVGAKLKFNKSDGKLNKHSKIMSIGFTESNVGNNRLCIQIRRHKNGKQYQLSFWENTGTMKSFKNSIWVSEEELGLHDDNISDKLAITLEIQKASTASGWSAIAKLENLTTNQKLTNISIANFDTNQDYFLSPLYAVINTAEPVSSSKCSNIVIDELFIKS